jgi:hypothetical protein
MAGTELGVAPVLDGFPSRVRVRPPDGVRCEPLVVVGNGSGTGRKGRYGWSGFPGCQPVTRWGSSPRKTASTRVTACLRDSPEGSCSLW